MKFSTECPDTRVSTVSKRDTFTPDTSSDQYGTKGWFATDVNGNKPAVKNTRYTNKNKNKSAEGEVHDIKSGADTPPRRAAFAKPFEEEVSSPMALPEFMLNMWFRRDT